MIKTLYANGDSWTFGQELKDDNTDHLTYKFYNTWPWHVAQELKIPQLVNEAQGGGSNDRIFRKTIDYIRNYKGKPEELLVIVAWTTYERFELPVAVKREHNNGYTDWESLDIEYTSMLMNSKPNVTDKLMLDYHKIRTMLNSSKVNSYKFFNLQWLLKQTCDNLGINLLQVYALDNPEFVVGKPEANNKWLDAISPYPISFNRQLMEVEHLEEVRAPGRHPNELGHRKLAKNIVAYLQQ
jgi:hypothetical protein